MVRKQCKYSFCCNTENNVKTCQKEIKFFPFPRAKNNLEQCKRWILACGRDDLSISKISQFTHYICSEHFFDGQGPTNVHPDPLPFENTLDHIDPEVLNNLTVY